MGATSTIYFVLLGLFVITVQVVTDRVEGEGDRCIVKKTKEFGLCVSIDRCDALKELLKGLKWKRPQQCSKDNFVGIYPLVCCPTPRSEAVCQVFYGDHVPQCLQTEVSGGEKAKSKEFPHMAALGYGKNLENVQWFCGGSLISEQFILSAAHCIHTDYGTVKFIRLGDLVLETAEDFSRIQDFTVRETFVHPKYKPPSYNNDIALIKLDRPARFSISVQPACLHYEVPVPRDLTITGWGKVDLIGSRSDHLLKANIFYVNHTTCASRYSSKETQRQLPNGVLNDIHLCAGHPKGKDTCPGDSGGPLQYQIFTPQPHYRIAGVTSFGLGCGLEDSIGIYARVSTYVEWIEDIVWPKQNFSLTQML